MFMPEAVLKHLDITLAEMAVLGEQGLCISNALSQFLDAAKSNNAEDMLKAHRKMMTHFEYVTSVLQAKVSTAVHQAQNEDES